ncbi:Uncharacterized protein GY17_00003124 [Cryptosporidium hominis]|uniref:Uncharacterized protein n=1 Tax=Cryptosporidium hominis TaxID=237895 RepID=A0ABX5BAP1_CRYHO|nr:Uncharacterized protein GY17_00003124 [Cryptosporidium hominis]|eukprot:PPS94000.1 Uncharacterized protein GY17_00003124 [Cryptosporidium hominis]
MTTTTTPPLPDIGDIEITPIPIEKMLDKYTRMIYDYNSGLLLDSNDEPIPGSQAGQIADTSNLFPTQTHKSTGLPIDPMVGLPFDPKSGNLVHPYTNQTMSGLSVSYLAAKNLTVDTDETYGLPIDTLTGYPLDPVSLIPFNPETGELFDPISDEIMNGTIAGIVSGISASESLLSQKSAQIDPATNMVVGEFGGLLNPATGVMIPGSLGPSEQTPFSPEIEDGGIIPPEVAAANADKFKLSIPPSVPESIPEKDQKIDSISELMYDIESGRLIGQVSKRPIPGSIAGDLNPIMKTPTQTDSVTGKPIDPTTGLPFNPPTGHLINPTNNNTMDSSFAGAYKYAVSNGIKTDNVYGLPVDEITGLPKDPVSDIPFNSTTGELVDPSTGKPIDNSTAGIISGKPGLPPIKDENGNLFDPSTNLPIDGNNQLINPETNSTVPGSTSGTTKPKPGIPVNGGGVVPNEEAKDQADKGKDGLIVPPTNSINKDPVTNAQYSNSTGNIINPETGKVIPGSLPGSLNYPSFNTPQQTDEITGKPVDTVTGLPYDPSTGEIIDPATKLPIPGSVAGDEILTEVLNITTDEVTGLPIDPETGLPRDPVSGLPQLPNGTLVDPSNKKPIPGSHSGFINGTSGEQSHEKDPGTGKPLDPNTGLPFDEDSGSLINPETGDKLQGSHSGTFMPVPGKPQGENGGIMTPEQILEALNKLPTSNEANISPKPSSDAVPDKPTNTWWNKISGQTYQVDGEKTIPGSAASVIHTALGTPTQTDPTTGLPSDPSTGLPFIPGFNVLVDPQTGEQMKGSVPYVSLYVKEKNIVTEAAYGLPVDPKTGFPIDPISYLPFAKNGELIDPISGKYFSGSIAGFISGKAGTQSKSSDESGNPIDPSTNMPYDPKTGKLIDPESGIAIDNSISGVFATVPGTAAPKKGGVIPESVAAEAAKKYFAANVEGGEGEKVPPPPESSSNIAIQAAGGASAAVGLVAAGVGAWYASRNRQEGEDDDDYADGFEAEYEEEEEEEGDEAANETVVTIERDSSFWNES